jgi:trk system potassium uptake protein TrkH
MSLKDIFRILAFYLWILLIPLSIPLFIALYCDWIVDPGAFPQLHSTFAFVATFFITAALGGFCFLVGRSGRKQLYRREALLLVLIVYFLTPVIGGLPFFLNKTLKNPVDAYFEAASALTTTGATILFPKKYHAETNHEIPYRRVIREADKETTYVFFGTVAPVFDKSTTQGYIGIEALSYSLLFWRSFMQWLGGGGIIVLFVAILPALGVGGKILVQTEITGPTKESFLPRVKETASQLWKIYLILTLGEILLLMITNRKMSLFDATLLSMSTLSTGGFTPYNLGVAAFDNLATECVLMLFMILGSINFSIFFYCFHGRLIRIKDPELRLFLIILGLSILFAAWQLTGTHSAALNPSPHNLGNLSFFEALRYASFQIISAQTSTGFATANYDLWPFSVQLLMLVLTYVGGMAGSTAGGIKVIRHQTFFQIMRHKIEAIYRPDAVRTIRIGHTIIDQRTATTVLSLFMLAASLTILGTFLLVLDGVDPQTSLTTIACMANNGGFGFRMCGPTESFAFLSLFGKLISCIWMIAGRLEYYALLIAFVPAFWRTSY